MIKVKFELPNLNGNLVVKTPEEASAFTKEVVKRKGRTWLSMYDYIKHDIAQYFQNTDKKTNNL